MIDINDIPITEVRVDPIECNGGLVGFANIVFANCLYLASIGIFTKRSGGYRLTYPTRNNSNGSFHIFHPIKKEIGERIERLVLEKYEEELRKKTTGELPTGGQ